MKKALNEKAPLGAFSVGFKFFHSVAKGSQSTYGGIDNLLREDETMGTFTDDLIDAIVKKRSILYNIGRRWDRCSPRKGGDHVGIFG